MHSRREHLEAMRALIDEEIAKLPPETIPPPSSPPFMTVDEYARRIRVRPATIRRMVREENLPHVRPRPRLIRIRVHDADQWVALRKAGTVVRRNAAMAARKGVAR